MNSYQQAGKIRETEQGVLNQSFDTDFNLLAVEQTGYDATSNAMRRVAVDPNGAPLGSLLTQQIDYAGGANAIYLGYAAPGTATSATSWLIKKITYDGNGNPTAIQYAGGVPTFTQQWTNRASLSYS